MCLCTFLLLILMLMHDFDLRAVIFEINIGDPLLVECLVECLALVVIVGYLNVIQVAIVIRN